MKKAEIESMAAALYDGGWRPEDWEDLMKEYELTEDEALRISDELMKIENDELDEWEGE